MNQSAQKKTAINRSFLSKFNNSFVKIFLFFTCFLSILYFVFPYSIVRNYFESQIQAILVQNNISIDLKITSARPYWITGLQFKNISVQNVYDNKRSIIQFDKITARISILPLFIGRMNANFNFQQKNKGNSKIFISIPLSAVLHPNDITKYEAKAEFEHFDLHGMTDQILGIIQNSASPALALITPVIAVTSFGGYLNGAMKLKIENQTSNGFANLNFDQLYFFVNDPSLNIPKQTFKQSKFFIEWDQNAIHIDDQTVFESENFYLKPKGSIKKIEVARVIDLGVLLILSGSLEKNFGFLVPQLLKCPSNAMIDGVMNVKLVGSLPQYQCE